MARLAWALLLLVAACSASEVSRIVGGTPAEIEDYPFTVQVQRWYAFAIWSQNCGGIILTRQNVLSAARCFAEPLARPQNRRIIAGATWRNIGGVVSNVAHIYNHPSYGQNGYDGDISVVRLETPLTYSNSIAQGSIIAQGAVIPDNLPVAHVGWGRTSFFGERSEQLSAVTVLTVNNDLCAERYLNWPSQPLVTKNMICAGLLDVAADGTCFGDAGGPLIYDNIVIGVASWGRTCANGTYPDISTAVSSYTNWIVSTVNWSQ